MRIFWICALFQFVTMAEWPPTNCPYPAKIKDSSVILTSTTNKEAQCEIQDPFSGPLYVKFSRIYQLTEDSASSLSFDFLFQGEKTFSLELSKNRLQVIPHVDMNVNKDACVAVLAHSKSDWFNWMRVEVDRLNSKGRTFVAVDLWSPEKNTFQSCVRFEMDVADSTFRLRLRGYTTSNVRQEVHEITDTMPETFSDVSDRLEVLEAKVQRLHTTLNRYMGYHDDHARITSDRHFKLDQQITTAKNGFQSQTTSHLLTYLFIITILLIGTCWWTTYKIKQANRVHVL